MKKFFIEVRKEIFTIPFVDASSVTASSTENHLSNYVTQPMSTSTISFDCTEQESFPDAPTLINQKPTPKQEKLNVTAGAEKDILLFPCKNRDHLNHVKKK